MSTFTLEKDTNVIYTCLPDTVDPHSALRSREGMLAVRSRLVAAVALAIFLTGCAAATDTAGKPPTFEEQLDHLRLLRSRDTITDEEYALMRRRLVETFDPASLRPRVESPPREAGRPPEPLSVDWLAGSWRGTHVGNGAHWMDLETVMEFSRAGEELTWTMTRRFRFFSDLSEASASGTATLREDRIELTGAYVDWSRLGGPGTPLAYELRRAREALEGHAAVADPMTRTLLLYRRR